MNGFSRGEHMHHEEVKPHSRDDGFDDDLGRAEPVLRLAAVEHQLQPADTHREHAEADPVELHSRRRGSVFGRNTAIPAVASTPNGKLTKKTQRQLYSSVR